MASLLRAFADAVARHPDRIAIVDGRGRQTSFAGLQHRAESLAAAWHAKGIGKGDRVLLAMALNADLYASLAALWSLGATVVLPEPAMGLAGLRHAVRSTKPAAFCSSGAYGLLKYALPELWPLRHLRLQTSDQPLPAQPEPEAADIALISFTSGTSGAPKAIPRSHGFLAAQHQAIAPLLDSAQAERDLVAFPVFVLINIASGQTSVLPNWKMSHLSRLAPMQLRSWIDAQRVTRVLLPPALGEKLAQTPASAGLHTVFTGGGPVFPALIDALQAAQPELRIVCVYGSTEAEPIADLDVSEVSAQDRADMASGQGLLVGKPVADIQVRIQGHEIQVAGAHVNGGYLDPAHDRENKIHADGKIWHRTGDAGFFDDAGRLWLLGRVGSEVQLDGRTVYPFAIETAARDWPGVGQSALMPGDTQPVLVIAGDQQHLPQWERKAAAFGPLRVMHMDVIPTDRRHGSKIDRAALKRLIK